MNPTRPQTPEVIQLAKKLYEDHCAGCCLHITLDDGNVRDSDVEFCMKRAIEKAHPLCQEIAGKLLLMTKTQRLRVRRGRYGLHRS